MIRTLQPGVYRLFGCWQDRLIDALSSPWYKVAFLDNLTQR